MANSFKNRFSLLGTYNTMPQKLPPSKVNPVGTDTLNNSEFLLSKSYFKLLQSIHHTEILSEALRTGVPPLGMARKVAHLTAFIKPAAPDEIVLSEIKNNTIEWLNNNLRTLTKHYDKIQKDSPLTLGTFSEEALERALRWARQRYGRGLTPSSVITLRSLLNSPIIDPLPPAAPLVISDRTAFPPLPTRPPTASFPFKHRNTLILPSRPLPIPSLLSLPPFSLGLIRHFPPASAAAPAPQPPWRPCPPLPQRLPLVRPRPSPVILPMQTTLTDTIPLISIDHTPVTLSKSPTSVPEPLITSLTCSTPRPSRLSRRRCPTQDQLRPLSPPQVSTPLPPPLQKEISLSVIKQSSTDDCAKKQLSLRTFTAEIHPCPLSPPLLPPADDVPTTTGEEINSISSHQAPSFLPNSPFSPPPSSLSPPLHLPSPSGPSLDDQSGSTSRNEPRVHAYTNRKASAWSLPIRQPIIIMGDSNIARIPKFKPNGIQADSYPGATLRHLTAILLRLTSPRPDTKLILFSIGINNCLREQTALTITKDTRRLIRLAREKFPQARIVVPLLTVSIKLSTAQLHCVKAFNTFVREGIEYVDSRSGYLNQLSLLKFKTTHDNIHWTPETGRLMMKDWLIQLDL